MFQQEHYLENFVQCIFDSLEGFEGKTLVIGGDGRFHNDRAIQTIIKMAAASGFGDLLVGQGGLLSTPAASAVIRKTKVRLVGSSCRRAIILVGRTVISASNTTPAMVGRRLRALPPRSMKAQQRIQAYKIADVPDIDLGEVRRDEGRCECHVHIIDPVEDYAELMQSLFDFDKIRTMFEGGFKLRFDAMQCHHRPLCEERPRAVTWCAKRGRW